MKLLSSIFVTLTLALISVQANTKCPGAPESSYGGGQLGCVAPVCTVAGGGLRPSSDPTKYFVCANPNISYEMQCAPGTCFSYEYQVCVWPWDWADTCQRAEEPATTTTTTTSAPTETEPSPSTAGPTETEPTQSTTLTSSTTTLLPVETTAETTQSSTQGPSSTSYPSSTTISSTTTTETRPTKPTDPTTTTSAPTTTEEPIITPVHSTTAAPIPTENEGRYVKLCPGSDPAKLTYGEQACTTLPCNDALYMAKWQMPSDNPEYYYNCFSPTVMATVKCPTGTCFHYGRQRCVLPAEWENTCSGI